MSAADKTAEALADALRQCAGYIAYQDYIECEDFPTPELLPTADQCIAAARAALDGATAQEPTDEEIAEIHDSIESDATFFRYLRDDDRVFVLRFARAVRAWPNTGERR